MVENMLYFRFTIFVVVVFSFNCMEDRVRLEDIKELTLHAGRTTTARRYIPVTQLKCVGGSANCNSQYLPKVVQCKNQGSDGSGIQWDCSAELKTKVRFGTVEVICEGYSKQGDSYVLVGSCNLEYYLELTSKGKEEMSRKSQSNVSKNNYNVFLYGAFVLFIFGIYPICILFRVNRTPPNKPPPPYSSNHGSAPAYSTDKAPSLSQFGSDKPYQKRPCPDLQQQIPAQQRSPGFWSCFLDFIFASNRNNNAAYNRRDQTYWSTSDSSSTSSWDCYDSGSSGGGDDSCTSHGYGGTSVR